ncbi:MAG: hypothetical protein AAB036_06730 [Elusimicrobiota bacterium]
MEGVDRLFVVVSLLIVSRAGASWAAQNGQEAVCDDPAVIMCENFEDRSLVDYSDMSRAKFKNSGWNLSNPAANNQGERVVGTQSFDGTKAFQFQYSPGSNGAGFLDTPVPGGSDVYIRWYAKWSSNYAWSSVSTKHFEYGLSAGNPGNIHLWSSNWGDSKLHLNTNNATFQRVVEQNIQPFFNVALDTWTCLEVRIKMNSGLGSADGVIEGWINGRKQMDHPSIEVWNASAIINSLMMSGYWNCAQPPGDCSTSSDYKSTMYRWHDNIVMSKQRVGCLPGQGGTPPSSQAPAAPRELRLP